MKSIIPSSAADLAAILRECSERGQAVVPWGGGTLQHLGGPPPEDALALHTTALDQIVEYAPADLTVTVEAGITLGAIQAALGEYGQWLPWEVPLPERATLGGLLAAGLSGPLRLGYGTPRDWVLGMRVALAGGRLVKSGGRVVKNVAGYELHKLHIGALGTLGLIVEATFKVAPIPERLETLALVCPTLADALALAGRLRERPLAPVSVVALTPPPPFDPSTPLRAGPAQDRHLPLRRERGSEEGTTPSLRRERGSRRIPALIGQHGDAIAQLEAVILLARFGGVAAAVERQLSLAAALAAEAGAVVVELDGTQSQAIWRDVAGFAMPSSQRPTPAFAALSGQEAADTLVLRAGARPSLLGSVLDGLKGHAPGGPAELVGYAGVGLAYARWPLPASADASMVAPALAALRAALAPMGGYVVVEDAPEALRGNLDRWGPPPGSLPLMRALKAQWDARGILNPGRYVGG